MKLHLPEDYEVRSENILYSDVPSNLTYQPDVYKFADYLATRSKLNYIIDIGCGSAGKLKSMAERFSIIGIDSVVGIEMARKNLPSANLIAHDLEQKLPEFPAEILGNCLIICSDVIEHMKKPATLMKQLAELAHIVPYIVLSTPDRDRARGWLDQGPPANQAHVMEWNGTEFVRFMRACGFEEIPFHGHTVNTDFHKAKTTLVTVTGQHATHQPVARKRVAAVIHGYNESDILIEVFDHLGKQGIEVHYFDNWSTDGSWDLANKMLAEGRIAHCTRFPSEPGNQYEWHAQLTHTTDYAKNLNVDWIMHHDADEIRFSPWNQVRMVDAISFIDSLGYNAIDFTVIDFRFTKNNDAIEAGYESKLNHFEFGRRPGHLLQIKCWKNNVNANLANSGGHDVEIPEKKVFPLKFLLKHYSLRNKNQATKKIFDDRLPRFSSEKEKYNWHHQYDTFKERNEVIGWSYENLIPWSSFYFQTEYIVERLSGIGLR